jgi:hypothetical protein
MRKWRMFVNWIFVLFIDKNIAYISECLILILLDTKEHMYLLYVQEI